MVEYKKVLHLAVEQKGLTSTNTPAYYKKVPNILYGRYG
jgi:hypothetical protein